jgi:RNA polymerase sigma-70 factor (ECF subfamily)
MSTARRANVIPLRRPDAMPDMRTDDALLAACVARDATALATLFERHHEPVRRFLARLAAGDSEDLVQTTFLEAWRGAATFRGQASARAWLLGIAANVARHHVRGEVRRRAALTAFGAGAGGASSTSRPDEQAARNQLLDRLSDALARLSHDLRVVFLLCDVEGVPGVDAAAVLGVREGTLWRRLHDARRKLRDALEVGR